jgi:hypothetical protein
LNKESVGPNQFYFGYAGERIYLADDPTDRKVAATVAAFAFDSTASDVLVSNISVEKYASVAQKGAIHASEGTRWVIENCEVCWNSGGGIGTGPAAASATAIFITTARIGIADHGRDIGIRNNMVRHNGRGYRGGFWRAEIGVAASQDVEVDNNTLTIAARECGLVPIDQGRRTRDGGEYKTRDNTVRDNDSTFEGVACAGGASDTRPHDKNFAIITDGNNRFDNNLYRTPRSSGPARFFWGHDITDWDGFRRKGLEQSGQIVLF